MFDEDEKLNELNKKITFIIFQIAISVVTSTIVTLIAIR